jgi:hypothetical protein
MPISLWSLAAARYGTGDAWAARSALECFREIQRRLFTCQGEERCGREVREDRVRRRGHEQRFSAACSQYSAVTV